jgi:hypothetical protein
VCAKSHGDGKGDQETLRNPIKSERLKSNPATLMDLVDLQQLHFEAQNSVWWDDGWKPTSSVSLQMLQKHELYLGCKLTYVVRRYRKNSFLIKGKLGNA